MGLRVPPWPRPLPSGDGRPVVCPDRLAPTGGLMTRMPPLPGTPRRRGRPPKARPADAPPAGRRDRPARDRGHRDVPRRGGAAT
jgi:hypothetical protein